MSYGIQIRSLNKEKTQDGLVSAELFDVALLRDAPAGGNVSLGRHVIRCPKPFGRYRGIYAVAVDAAKNELGVSSEQITYAVGDIPPRIIREFGLAVRRRGIGGGRTKEPNGRVKCTMWLDPAVAAFLRKQAAHYKGAGNVSLDAMGKLVDYYVRRSATVDTLPTEV